MHNVFLPGLNGKSGTSLKFAQIYLYDNMYAMAKVEKSAHITIQRKRNKIYKMSTKCKCKCQMKM